MIILKTEFKTWFLCKPIAISKPKYCSEWSDWLLNIILYQMTHLPLSWCHLLGGCFGPGLGMCPKLVQLDQNGGSLPINVEGQVFSPLFPNANKDNLYPQREPGFGWTNNLCDGADRAQELESFLSTNVDH